jgi:hypothetical protein
MTFSRKIGDKAATMSENLGPQKRVIESFADACEHDVRIAAAFVGGSFATGTADAFSDVDLYAIVRLDAYDALLAEPREFFERFGQPVFLEHFDGFEFDMFVFILDDGVQGELGIARPGRFLHIHGGPFRVLVDKEGLLEGVTFPRQRPTEEQQLETLRETLHWFWRDVSLCGVAMARRRLWTAAGCLASMRRRCVDLARLEADFGAWANGYEKLEEAIKREVLADLERSFPVFEGGAMAGAVDCLIAFYRRVAPELARKHGVDYPLSLEEAVLRALSKQLAHGRGVRGALDQGSTQNLCRKKREHL